MTRLFAGRADVRIGWLLVAALALGGYGAIVAPGERRARAMDDRARDLYQLANRNDRLLKNAAGLDAARHRVARDVAQLSAASGAARTMLATLRLLRTEGSRFRVVISGLSPGERSGAPAGEGYEDVTIALRGAYRNVLGTIADLSRHDVLVEVHDVALAQTSSGLGANSVAATIHATLYHRIAAVMREKNHAQSADR
ncbi:MAG: hypothetical protein ABI231_08475 [Candidatus Tumulicola sp.]